MFPTTKDRYTLLHLVKGGPNKYDWRLSNDPFMVVQYAVYHSTLVVVNQAVADGIDEVVNTSISRFYRTVCETAVEQEMSIAYRECLKAELAPLSYELRPSTLSYEAVLEPLRSI